MTKILNASVNKMETLYTENIEDSTPNNKIQLPPIQER